MPEQARLFARATIVVGEAGAAMANVGFCQPGTRVLEIQTESFGDSWTRATCFLMGQFWYVFCASDISSDDPRFPIGIKDLRGVYEVDAMEFKRALDALLDESA